MTVWQIRAVLLGVVCSMAMIFLDQSGVSVTLVDMRHSIGLSDISQLWVVNAYLLMLACFMLLAGRLADYLGYKRLYMLGHLLFLLASILSGCAQNAWMMLLGRSVQGFAASIMITGNVSIATLHFAPEKRGHYIGMTAAFGALFLALGPLIAGALTELASWRYLFFINVPLAALAIVMIRRYCPEDPVQTSRRAIDINGLLLQFAFFVLLVFPFMQAPSWGWYSAPTIAMWVLAAFTLVIFVYYELRIESPFVNLRLLKNRIFTFANLVLFSVNLPIVLPIFWALWLQIYLGFSPLMTGIALIPSGLPVMFMAIFAGKLCDRYGGFWPVLVGSLFILVAVLWANVAVLWHHYWLLFPSLLVSAIGFPLVITPTITVVMNETPKSQSGMASGMLNTMRQLSAAFGLAVMGSVINSLYIRPDEPGVFASYGVSFAYGVIIASVFSLFVFVFAFGLRKKRQKPVKPVGELIRN